MCAGECPFGSLGGSIHRRVTEGTGWTRAAACNNTCCNLQPSARDVLEGDATSVASNSASPPLRYVTLAEQQQNSGEALGRRPFRSGSAQYSDYPNPSVRYQPVLP